MRGAKPVLRALAAAMLLLQSGLGLAQPSAEDPYLWLEEVQGERALRWVQGQNEASLAALQSGPQSAAWVQSFAEVLASPKRLTHAQQMGGYLYNFWRDAEHPRGLWRRTSLASYRSDTPRWETVLDVDQLSREEGAPWVWGGATCLVPQTQRCLLTLSRGGGDAHVLREFDLGTRRFVAGAAGGFSLPEAKGNAAWVDRDTLSVATDFGPGSMTESGYPRQVKLWKRGQPLVQARLVFEAAPQDVSVWTWAEQIGKERVHVIERRTSFFAGEQHVLQKDVRLLALSKPADASMSPFADQWLIELRSDWTLGGKTHAAGSLLAISRADWAAGKRQFHTLFSPTPRSSLQSHVATRSAVLGVRMDEARQQLVQWRYQKGLWQETLLPAGDLGSLSVSALAGQDSDRYLLTRSDFLTPARLELGEVGRAERQLLQAMPEFFDASRHDVQQLQARSKDGTAVPYFIVKPRGDLPKDGAPTLLYGYGGFEISMKPSYSGILGRGWLSQGGVYVLANLRGGGEFGPRWHQSAQREHRQRSFDDFIAVAEDLIQRGITRPARLGIMGGSLGGLLTSVAMVQRPELFGAVVSQVPLTDMRRYHRMLAGASWIEEYGNPDSPEQWDYISRYSPYQNARAGQPYPKVLYTSSTLDDRVHPGHARKMVARLQELGQPALYWENREGGHAGASTPAQQAQLWALSYGFLREQLMGPKPAMTSP